MTDWQSRLSTDIKMVPANQLQANPFNARRHPGPQREALRGSLDTLGFVAPILVGKQTQLVLDGHARVEEALTRNEEMLLPVIEVDITEDEEKLFLASFDWITALATYDRDSLDSLLQDVSTDDERLQTMLSEMAKDQGLYIPDDFPEYDESIEDSVEYHTCPHCGEKFPK